MRWGKGVVVHSGGAAGWGWSVRGAWGGRLTRTVRVRIIAVMVMKIIITIDEDNNRDSGSTPREGVASCG